MRRIRKLAPEIPAQEILNMATIHGSMALAFSHLAGSLHPGSESRLLAIEAGDAPPKDPLEFLVQESVEGHFSHVGIWSAAQQLHLVK